MLLMSVLKLNSLLGSSRCCSWLLTCPAPNMQTRPLLPRRLFQALARPVTTRWSSGIVSMRAVSPWCNGSPQAFK